MLITTGLTIGTTLEEIARERLTCKMILEDDFLRYVSENMPNGYDFKEFKKHYDNGLLKRENIEAFLSKIANLSENEGHYMELDMSPEKRCKYKTDRIFSCERFFGYPRLPDWA